MELEMIFWARQRRLQERLVNHDGRITTLEDHSTQSSAKSDNRWKQIKWLAELTEPAASIIGFIGRHWGVITLIATAIWTGLRWLLRMLHIM